MGTIGTALAPAAVGGTVGYGLGGFTANRMARKWAVEELEYAAQDMPPDGMELHANAFAEQATYWGGAAGGWSGLAAGGAVGLLHKH